MDAFTGEIRILPYSFVPYGWAECNGQQISINQNQALYAVIGQYYGGDGQTYFNVPDLRGQVALGTGSGPGLSPRSIAQKTGAESVALTINQMAAHTHTVTAKFVGGSAAPSMLATPASDSWLSRTFSTTSAGTNINYPCYTASGTPDVALATQTFGSVGAASPQGHENRQPFLPMRFCICTNGLFPVNPG